MQHILVNFQIMYKQFDPVKVGTVVLLQLMGFQKLVKIIFVRSTATPLKANSVVLMKTAEIIDQGLNVYVDVMLKYVWNE